MNEKNIMLIPQEVSESLIVIPEEIPKGRAKKLYNEFREAWSKTSTKEKQQWALESIKLFAKVTIRRGKGFIRAVGTLLKSFALEILDLGKSIYKGKVLSHLNNRKIAVLKMLKNARSTSKKIITNTIYLLKNNPKESAPLMLLGVLGFFCGAGTEIGDKTWYDIDGGVPDLDITVGGLGNHRSILFHSIISAAVLETMVFSMVSATKIIHSKLPEKHDSFWDQVASKTDWAEAFVVGACTGIAYHLLIDGTLDGSKALSDFPISMSMEGHNAFFITNAAAEIIDLDKKKAE